MASVTVARQLCLIHENLSEKKINGWFSNVADKEFCWAVALFVSFSLIPDTHARLISFSHTLTHSLSFSSHVRILQHSHIHILSHTHAFADFFITPMGGLLWRIHLNHDASIFLGYTQAYFGLHTVNGLIQHHGKQNLKGLKGKRKDWGQIKF